MSAKRALLIGMVAFAAAACDDDPPETELPDAELPITTHFEDFEDELQQMAWYREGRPVIYEDREWVPWGDPVLDPIVTPVGDFEGTQLYARSDATRPYDRLFIPLEDNYWLGLFPRDMLPDTAGAVGQDTAPGAPTR